MNKFLFVAIVAASVTFNACKPKATETAETPAVDTTAVAATPAPAPMDSAAVAAKQIERHATVKGTNATKYQKHEGKEVRYDSDPVFLHHEHEDVQPLQGADAGASADAASSAPVDLEGYYYLPATWATFPGGEVALDKFLAENLKYPRQAIDAGVQGTVYTSLYVDEMGQVIDARFPGKRLGYGLEEEVARVIKMMPRWNPGSYNNAQVKSKFVLPVRFEIKG